VDGGPEPRRTRGHRASPGELAHRLLPLLRRAGATGAQVFGVISDQIAAAWPDGEFPHHGGHGVGLTVFDDPHIIPAGDWALESWMVMAVEPGVYLPGRFGVRCENLFLVTPGGAVELAQSMARPLSPQAQTTWSR
jgi:Xaa-Pro aminopeptidase